MTDKTLNYEPLHEFAARNRVSYTELCVAVRAALAAQAQPAEPVAWMPIESSPKDGAWMYVWRKHGTFPIQAKYNIKYAWFEDDDANHLYNLTHWMPLPAAPGAAPPAPAAVPLTKEQRELFDLILHHYGPDKRLQPLRDLIAAAGDKP
jgi:hypothetical protein